MAKHIASDAVLTDIIHLLADPETYMQGISSNYASYVSYRALPCSIQIGVSGTGLYPNYKIQEPSYVQTVSVRTIEFSFTITPARTFCGRTHREITEWDDLERGENTWSSKTFTLDGLRFLQTRILANTNKH